MGGSNSVIKVEEDKIKEYAVKDLIGKGSFGEVRGVVRKKDGKEFAMKIYSVEKVKSFENYDVEHEAQMMAIIDHPNIVKVYDTIRTDKNVYIIMDLLKGPDLFAYIKKHKSFEEYEAARIFKQITRGIKYLHSLGIVHRDLTPTNLLFVSDSKDSNIKITDFGLAKYQPSRTALKNRGLIGSGTSIFIAPEMWEGKELGTSVDCWSLGIVLFNMLGGKFDAEKLWVAIKKNEDKFQAKKDAWKNVSEEGKNLISGLLNPDPKSRLSLERVLEHQWFKIFCPD